MFINCRKQNDFLCLLPTLTEDDRSGFDLTSSSFAFDDSQTGLVEAERDHKGVDRYAEAKAT